MMRGCEFVRAGEEAEGLQGLLYAAGVTSATTSTVRLGLHRGIDSAGFIARGTVRTWRGERLEDEQLLTAGDFAFIPSDQDGIELLPELDALLDERAA